MTQQTAVSRLPPRPGPRVMRWRGRAGGLLMACASLALPVAAPGLARQEWHWPLPGSVDAGAILCMVPGAVLVAVLAPLAAYRRRDALTMLFFPPAGIRAAWIIGTRLARLPHRDWPVRAADGVPLHGRRAGQLAVAVACCRRWLRSRRRGAGRLEQRTEGP